MLSNNRLCVEILFQPSSGQDKGKGLKKKEVNIKQKGTKDQNKITHEFHCMKIG